MHASAFSFEVIADLSEDCSAIGFGRPVDERDDNFAHEPAALCRFMAVVGGFAGKAGVNYAFLWVVSVGDWNGR